MPSSGTQTYSALAPAKAMPQRIPKTWSPMANSVTSSPASTTTPENSSPGMVLRGQQFVCAGLDTGHTD